ncbi:hypothetical protein RUM43_000630 [Polyplax serrata]|uniref:Uncharacterized protein n=1 Tax=Polyplax serrata TaxID=468196 RepID=A0AAN8XND6_POLSC
MLTGRTQIETSKKHGWQFPNYPVCLGAKLREKHDYKEKFNKTTNGQDGNYYLCDYPNIISVSQWAVDPTSVEKSSSQSVEGEVNVVQKKCRPFWRSGKPRRQILPYWNLSSSEAKFESDKIGIKTSAERKFKYDAYEKFYTGVNEITEDTSEATELHQSKLVLKPTKGDKKIDVPPSCYYGKRNRKRKGKLSCSKNSCKKLTNVYTSEELRAILENFKIIHGIEGYNSSGDQSSTRVVPAYFVLKLAENSSGNEDGENSKGKCPSSTQSFKLIFANDKLKNSSKRKTLESSFQCKSCTLVKTKDKTAQTIQPDEGNAGNEIDNPKSQVVVNERQFYLE